MPVHRRRAATQIAKINAKSVDGYFGEGTPCFFIRGTILSDAPVDGEYRTLPLERPGNAIEIESFDGDWALVSIATHAGSRPGDNIRGRVWLRDADLKAIGIDCASILAGVASFDRPVEELVEADVAPAALVPAAASTNGNGYRQDFVVEQGEQPEAAAFVPPPLVTAPRSELSAEPAVARGRTTFLDSKILIEIGASVIAIALPLMLLLLRTLFTKKDD